MGMEEEIPLVHNVGLGHAARFDFNKEYP